MAQKVLFKRKTTSEIEDLAVEDGSLIYNVENGKTYMDYGNERIPTGGGANGGIYVGDTEPTDEDITLWVDTNTSETKASEIVNEYTESDTVGYSTNYVNDLVEDVYSTSEVKTNKVWIDGKPIYRKTLINTSITLSSTGALVGNISANIDTWVSSYHRIGVSGSDGKASGRTGYLNSNYYSGIQLSANGDVRLFAKEESNTTRYVLVIIEYTKTTD